MTDASRKIPTPDDLHRLLICNFDTGELTWRERAPGLFIQTGVRPPEEAALAWNNRNAGNPAFTGNSLGYKRGSLFGKMYKAHRVIWAMHTGAWPREYIDHINGKRSDNRISNLREVSHAENARNAKLYVTNTSGVTGVLWDRVQGKWVSRIKADGNLEHLGTFASKDDAAAARAAAEAKYNFHPNHGRKSDA